MKRKPKPVRCWMVTNARGLWWVQRYMIPDHRRQYTEYGCTITPGYFVPDAKKERRK